MPIGDFYEPFWSEFRLRNGDLNTHSGYRRRAEDLRQHYVGARSDHWPNVYCHIGFTMLDGPRKLFVEFYTGDREGAGWEEFRQQISGLALAPPLVLQAQAGDTSARMIRYLTGPLTQGAMAVRREELMDLASQQYRGVVGHILPLAPPPA
ncbi:MAG: hypothetical protein Q8P18_21900 [Pseudomonadota bacterium]|nr:hypothetical protein [Pseudomonadota bacterium]